MPTHSTFLLSVCLAAAVAEAQSVQDWQTAAGGKQAFEVASVRKSNGAFAPPSFPLDEGDSFRPTGNAFHADFPLTVLIQFAYKFRLPSEQMQTVLARAPKWVATDRFTIQARAEGSPTKDQFRLMVQSLLADRFKLAIHFETQEMPVFALTLLHPGKLGPKLRPHAEGPPCDPPGGTDVFPPTCDILSFVMNAKSPGTRMLGSRHTTLEYVAAAIGPPARLGRPVLDRTGLSGRYDFVVEWMQEPEGVAQPGNETAADLPGPSFLDALREQLGLKLEGTRGPVRMPIIDRVERPTEN